MDKDTTKELRPQPAEKTIEEGDVYAFAIWPTEHTVISIEGACVALRRDKDGPILYGPSTQPELTVVDPTQITSGRYGSLKRRVCGQSGKRTFLTHSYRIEETDNERADQREKAVTKRRQDARKQVHTRPQEGDQWGLGLPGAMSCHVHTIVSVGGKEYAVFTERIQHAEGAPRIVPIATFVGGECGFLLVRNGKAIE